MRTGEPQRVVEVLGLRTVLPANWRSGLAEAALSGVFVTPVQDGWVLAVGADLRAAAAGDEALLLPLLARLGAAFGDVAWFLTDAAADRHGWALVRRGVLQRGYAYDGEVGHAFWHGEVTDAERALGCFVDDPRDRSDDDVKWWPDERIVLELAAAWSVDPCALAHRAAGRSVGCLGRL